MILLAHSLGKNERLLILGFHALLINDLIVIPNLNFQWIFRVTLLRIEPAFGLPLTFEDSFANFSSLCTIVNKLRVT